MEKRLKATASALALVPTLKIYVAISGSASLAQAVPVRISNRLTMMVICNQSKGGKYTVKHNQLLLCVTYEGILEAYK